MKAGTLCRQQRPALQPPSRSKHCPSSNAMRILLVLCYNSSPRHLPVQLRCTHCVSDKCLGHVPAVHGAAHGRHICNGISEVTLLTAVAARACNHVRKAQLQRRKEQSNFASCQCRASNGVSSCSQGCVGIACPVVSWVTINADTCLHQPLHPSHFRSAGNTVARSCLTKNDTTAHVCIARQRRYGHPVGAGAALALVRCSVQRLCSVRRLGSGQWLAGVPNGPYATPSLHSRRLLRCGLRCAMHQACQVLATSILSKQHGRKVRGAQMAS